MRTGGWTGWVGRFSGLGGRGGGGGRREKGKLSPLEGE